MADIRFNNSFSLAGGFNITNAEPIDSRMYVADIQHIYSADNWVKVKPYPGLIVSDPNGEVRICVNSNFALESSWKKIGGGSLAVETYGEAIALATEENIGQIIYVKTKSSYPAEEDLEEGATAIEYDAAPYMVIGEGNLMKLAMSTASGDIDGDVAELKTKVSNLQTTVGNEEGGLVKEVADNTAAIALLNEIDHDAYIAADTQLKGDLEGQIAEKVDKTTYEAKVKELSDAVATKAEAETVNALSEEVDKKVEKVEGSRLMQETEGDKLAGIAEGAQVNVIETVKVNGNALEVTDKSVNIEIEAVKVKGVDGADKMLSLTENGEVKSELSIVYVKAEESEDGKPHIALFGKGGTTLINTIDATDFIKDGMVSNVELVDTAEGSKALKITWNTDAGKEEVSVPVGDLMDYYYAGNGIALNDERKFSIDLKEGETLLTVDAAGLGVDTTALWGAADAKYDAKNAASTAEENAKKYADELDSAMNTRVEALEAIDHEHENKEVLDGITAEKVSNWDAAEQNAKDYADETFVTKEGFNEFEAQYEEKLNGIAAGAEVNVVEAVKVNGVDATITDKVAEVKINAENIELGADITSEGETVYEGTAKLSAVLQCIQDSISVAVSGGLTGVVAGDGIEVSAVAANKQTISAKVSTEEGNLITMKDGALFAAMYYDGDDAE